MNSDHTDALLLFAKVNAKLEAEGATMKRFIIALGCILFASPALAQSAGEKTGVNSALGISPTTAESRDL